MCADTHCVCCTDRSKSCELRSQSPLPKLQSHVKTLLAVPKTYRYLQQSLAEASQPSPAAMHSTHV